MLSEAQSVFSKPTPIGLFTTWQRVTGQQFTPNRVLNINTGAFIRNGVNWNQIGWYGLDHDQNTFSMAWRIWRVL